MKEWYIVFEKLNTNQQRCLLWWCISSLLNERGVRPINTPISTHQIMPQWIQRGFSSREEELDELWKRERIYHYATTENLSRYYFRIPKKTGLLQFSVTWFNLNIVHTGSVFNTNCDWIDAAVAGLSLDHDIVENQNSFIPFTTIPNFNGTQDNIHG